MAPWDLFFKEKVIKILSEKKTVIDIGGGLRVSKKKGNRFDPQRDWIIPYLQKIDYKILDPIPDYEPDIIGDIHNLPLERSSVESIVCLAILEHIEDPFKACSEMHRVLVPGGYCLVYVPFLYYYHAEKTYYKDYWRYTKDSFPILFKNFSKMEIVSVRGAVGTLIRLSPLGRYKFFEKIGYLIDRLFGKVKSNQVSGYYIFLTK